ncbi:MarR family transcriptional regulator [Desulfuromonas sp. DDH964]|uniref:MarR family transcriptional regulator n=1 Tax=Desulfuromonas sp. DDH964 TaxID=1823759 RepID=UPI00078DF02A|nr:MarR family transcriptional regulator [Desulfuromonas sp. DDH964]AMV73348.1 hypothetical protein DBW_3040 [Desulfuromonas sp. DDH964]
MREVSNMLEAMELLRRRVHREMPIQHIVLLLTVAENPGITMPELVTRLDMPQGTVSRNVKILSSYVEWENGVARTRGRNLLRTLPDADNRHVLAVFLTGRGEALVQELGRTVGGSRSDGLAPKPVHRSDYAAGGLGLH